MNVMRTCTIVVEPEDGGDEQRRVRVLTRKAHCLTPHCLKVLLKAV
jgi:hypothetical protein